jgi:hypothetical protein
MQLPPTEDVEMDVIHGLTGVRSLVQDQSIAALGNSLFPRHVVGRREHPTEEVVVVELGDRLYVLSRQDQEMNRRLGVDVRNGDDVVIPVEGFELRVGDQPAEDAARQLNSSNLFRPTPQGPFRCGG